MEGDIGCISRVSQDRTIYNTTFSVGNFKLQTSMRIKARRGRGHS